MSKKGDVKREKRPDGKIEVWSLIEIEDDENTKQVHRNRITLIEKDLETILDFDETEVAQAAVEEERAIRLQKKGMMEKEVSKLRGLLG